MSLLDQIRFEKARMNRIRYIINYVVVPGYFLIVLVSLFVAVSLMSIDEHRYLPVFISVIAGFVVITTGLLASVPYVRKYDFVIQIETSNYFNQIQIMVNFALKPDRLLQLNEQESLSSFRIELTRELLFAIETFAIPIKNRSDMDYILDNREEAFTRIYKTGHI